MKTEKEIRAELDESYRAKILAKALNIDYRDRPTPPPKIWWETKKAEMKELHPDYDDGKINRAIGSIWWHRYNEEKRKAIILAEALKV